MTRHPLIFDWSKSEASRKDKLFAVMIVGLLFAFILGMIELNVPSLRSDPEEQGTIIRLADEEMARSWALLAEENGPFPGRLETDGENIGLMFEKDEKLDWWTHYEVSLRPMQQDASVARMDITPKGKREFPKRLRGHADAQREDTRTASLPREPILVPYDAAALEWLPDDLPGFGFPAAAKGTTDSLRFLVSLREDGSVAELIPLAGAADPAQEALEAWLRGIRFKKGNGERWFGLRIDFVNRRGNESQPE